MALRSRARAWRLWKKYWIKREMRDSKFGVLLAATESVSGHLGFAEQPLAVGSHERRPVTNVGKPVPGRWYGGQGCVRRRNLKLKLDTPVA